MHIHFTASAALVAVILGVALRFVTAIAIKQHNRYLQAGFSFVVTVLTLGVAALTNVTGNIDVVGFIFATVIAATTSTGVNGAWTGDIAGKLSKKTKSFGLGVDKSVSPAGVSSSGLPKLEPLQPVTPEQAAAAVNKPAPV